MVKKAKTTRGHIIQEAKATCSKAISEVEAQRASQPESFQREHGNFMQELEEQVIWEESRSQADFLSAWQGALYASPPELKSTLVASYHILLGQTPLLPPLILPLRASPLEEQPTSTAPPTPVPKQSVMTSFPDIHYGYNADVIGPIYYYLDTNTLVWCQHGIVAY